VNGGWYENGRWVTGFDASGEFDPRLQPSVDPGPKPVEQIKPKAWYQIGRTEANFKSMLPFFDDRVENHLQAFVENAVLEANRLGLEGKKLDVAKLIIERREYGHVHGFAVNVR
jgi:hypothetical protein